MSTRPGEAVIDAALEGQVLGRQVEAHLDAHPLPVDEAEVERITRRLEQRLPPRQTANYRGLMLVIGGFALAAAGLVALRTSLEQPMAPTAAPTIEVLQAVDRPSSTKVRVTDHPGTVTFNGTGRSLTLAPESEALTSVHGRVAVVLIQAGEGNADGVQIPESHWAVLTTVQGQSREVVFPDGQAPPALEGAAWEETDVHAQLRQLRWESLPDRTLETLDRLLEK